MIATVVLAAGSGNRFGALKQFALLRDAPLVAHAVERAVDLSDIVVVVLPEGHEWQDSRAVTVRGGPTRTASVRSGVAVVPIESDVIVIHDAAHPLASRRLFEAAIARVAAGAAAAVPVVPVTETLAHLVEDGLLETVSRAKTVVTVQSPQAFRADVLRRLLSEEGEARDEVSLFLSRGYAVVAVPGDVRNVHVTTSEELDIVSQLLLPPPV